MARAAAGEEGTIALMAENASVDGRIVLALERTLLAWTRTALALMAFGVVVARLPFITEMPANAGSGVRASESWIGPALVAVGALVQAVGLVSYWSSIRRVATAGTLPLRLVTPASVLAAVIVLACAAAALYLFLHR